MSRPNCTRCGEEMASRGRAGGWYCANPACWALTAAPPAPAPASTPGSGLREAAEQAVHALRCVEEDDTAPSHLLKVSTAALASQARYALEVALAVPPEPERCPEVVRRGTHWPLDPGEPCAGCGVIVPGSPVLGPPPESAPAPSTVEATGKPSSISPPSTPAETAPAAFKVLGPPVPNDWSEEKIARYMEQAAPAAPEVDLGEVPERLDAYARVLDDAWSDEAPARAAREAVEAAVRSLVERARREDVRVLEAAAGAQTRPERWAVLREAADMLRALTTAVPGAADEEVHEP